MYIRAILALLFIPLGLYVVAPRYRATFNWVLVLITEFIVISIFSLDIILSKIGFYEGKGHITRKLILFLIMALIIGAGISFLA
ncbi:hypothetical protein A2617_03315 [Candidatus Daviesbacteria bacterium RIFOXYD1_FULL_41_10]|uniref:Uncharacterized protein n=2 Tax=Candidatus Daviesiibacteriota TaxID=1752718 RepID=A0A1F5MYX6_9BACT|nr:MAG: hypothetical protein UU67_C0031G0005 [Candidatus Daviesbacteria bacterium GW2011_GWB1_41_5]OGE70555.1 MAG: hypothetical protein A2617_03315 [Candidatus Daviesbacteria bacterium RIFOXYD1_FULL_41_10]